ncbi:uncharacterized protein BDW70DRAFT_131276 [Aspergillus foveolatus]|uniref:uncharacterized protein n=1 Tax=Aspergillus foveolatus TaxID=210207 RepID=UPI003CCD3784
MLCSPIKRDRRILISSWALILDCWFSLNSMKTGGTGESFSTGFSSGLANGTSMAIIMRYIEQKGVKRGVRSDPKRAPTLQ